MSARSLIPQSMRSAITATTPPPSLLPPLSPLFCPLATFTFPSGMLMHCSYVPGTDLHDLWELNYLNLIDVRQVMAELIAPLENIAAEDSICRAVSCLALGTSPPPLLWDLHLTKQGYLLMLMAKSPFKLFWVDNHWPITGLPTPAVGSTNHQAGEPS
ncbi:hypothetical protein BJ138DRAFT_1118257 [Hygrophoropsis aurantiaca]|uniref:Uncharacterized protein n=1 Tax=Hygrophoropsis aurantiaca TaxID=72124 RepID=A0ACB7ZY65_9AGAM|nr:hypothetical protein BJ138DRAFT_1118257 [Hygrophoropsis aurantiaca]